MLMRTTLLLFVFTNGIGAVPCPPLPFVEHGTYKIARKNIVRVICDLPYIYFDPKNLLSTSTAIYCKKGKWSNPAPECLLPQRICKPPLPIENGKYAGFSPFGGGSTVQYYCEEGYFLKGPTMRTCHPAIYEWTDFEPYCIKHDSSIAGIATRIDNQFDKLNNFSSGSKLYRGIAYDLEFLGLDLFLVFDKSSSITPSDFQEGIHFAQLLIDRFNISNGDMSKVGGTRLSILTFGDDQTEILALDDTSVSTTKIAQQRMGNIRCGAVCDGPTNMSAALERVEFAVTHSSREEAMKAVLLTSGSIPNDADAVHTAAANLKQQDVEIYVIGIGIDVDFELLRTVTSKPLVEHLFLLDDFGDFDKMIKVIKEKQTQSPPPSLDKCGYLTEVGKKAIKAKPGQIKPAAAPWLASIVIADGDGSRFSCSGALICSQWVLTTASCLHKNLQLVQETDVYVILGEDNLAKDSGTEQYFYAKEIHINEYFTFDTIQDDLALIKLNDIAEFNDHVRTVCVPKAESVSTRGDYQLTLTGWLTVNEERSRLKNEPIKTEKPSQIDVKILGINECRTKLEKPIECHDKATVGASVGSEHGANCMDSSGSLLTTANEPTELIGLASKGKGCNLENKLAFFVRISLYYDWIRDMTSDCIKEHT